MADKKYSIDDILRIFGKLEKKIEDLSCFVKECCAKIPVNIGTGIGLFKKFNQNKWEFKSLLPGDNINITQTNNEVIISSTTNCEFVKNCIGITPDGDPNKYLNEQGDWETITIPPAFIESVSDTTNIDLTVIGTDLSADLTNTTVTPATYGDVSNIPQITVDQKGRITSIIDIPIVIPPNFITAVSDTSSIDLTVTGTTLSADFINNAGYITSAALSPYLTSANAALTYYPLTNPSGYTSNTGTVTSVQLASGTGISLSGTNPITTSGTITVTNTAPDQIVSIGTTGSGLSVTGSYPNFTLQNTLPDQTVVLTQGGTTTITGIYPNFTISSADQYTGTVTSVAALTLGTTGTDLSSTVANSTTTPVITLNVPTASATNRGALSSTDWSTFNNKIGGSGTTNEIAYFSGSSTIGSLTTGTYPSLTELSYVKGVTSAIQTQINTAKKDFRGCTVDGQGGVCQTGVIGYLTLPYACTITGWSIEATGTSPTCTFDVWKIASGTALPTVANTIMGTKPALSTGNVIQSTTMTGWTTTVNAGDIIGFNLDACTNATKITFQLYLTLT